jgi:hypothetical protein
MHGTCVDGIRLRYSLNRHAGMKIGIEQGVNGDETSNRLRVAFFENRYWCLPNNDAFSSHTGTCRLLGNKRLSGPAYPLKVGDFVCLGSVVLVISEIRTHTRNERLSSTDVQKLRADMKRYIENNGESFKSPAAILWVAFKCRWPSHGRGR